jgi:putative phage-type endonuclease
MSFHCESDDNVVCDIEQLKKFNNIIDKEIYKFIKNNNKINLLNKCDDIYNNNGIDKKIIFKRLKTIKNNRKILKKLLKIPMIEQRTKEWYDARDTRLTASDLYDAIKNNNNSEKIAKKKAKILVDNVNYNIVPALKWGTMFESMAIRCYSQINNNIKVHDFGLILDSNNNHFGASPDGINELGIMIEIKCPYSRKIVDGFIPEKYKMQIQGQLAVCNLTECDYIECEFACIENDEYMIKYKDIITNHGVIAEYQSNGTYKYLYSDEYLNAKDAYDNIYKKIIDYNTDNSSKFNKLIFWELKNINVQREIFNKEEWLKIVPKINDFWKSVENFKLMPIENNIKKFSFIDDSD